MNIKQLEQQLYSLNEIIKPIMNEVEYTKHFKLQVEFNNADPNEHMLFHTFSNLFSHLDYITLFLDYLQKPITLEGILTMDNHDNYKINNTTLCTQKYIEILQYEKTDSSLKPPSYWDVISIKNCSHFVGIQARIRE